MELSGWGRFPKTEAEISVPAFPGQIGPVLDTDGDSRSLIARGAGRSYGDSSLAGRIVSTRSFDNFIRFDAEHGEISCGSGVTIDQLLTISVPKGWLLPVLPGTRFISIGGAIAGDIHGKNHHLDGCFSQFVKSLTLMLASGEVVRCSTRKNARLFRATCGGMGLTGIILEASLKLEPISNAFIEQRTRLAANLEEVLALFDEQAGCKYSVAWLDCLAGKADRGRSVLFTGEPAASGAFETAPLKSLPAPRYSPGFLVNRLTMTAFNRLYFAIQSTARNRQRMVPVHQFFFPLDRVRNWNTLYGPAGFTQYQFVVPPGSARQAIMAVLDETTQQGRGSFLSVLKKLGPENKNLLSFPMEGYTLALDFKIEKDIFALLDRLDQIIVEHGGRLYLCKDARMSAATFRQTYPRWEEFCAVRAEVDPHGRFGSLQSKRLGLSD